MTNIQKKLLVGAAGIAVWSIGFYFSSKLTGVEKYAIGAIGSFVFGFLLGLFQFKKYALGRKVPKQKTKNTKPKILNEQTHLQIPAPADGQGSG